MVQRKRKAAALADVVDVDNNVTDQRLRRSSRRATNTEPEPTPQQQQQQQQSQQTQTQTQSPQPQQQKELPADADVLAARLLVRLLLNRHCVSWHRAAMLVAHHTNYLLLGQPYLDAYERYVSFATRASAARLARGIATDGAQQPTSNGGGDDDRSDDNAIPSMPIPAIVASESSTFVARVASVVAAADHSVRPFGFVCAVERHPLDTVRRVVTLRNVQTDTLAQGLSQLKPSESAFFTALLDTLLQMPDGVFEIARSEVPRGSTIGIKESRVDELMHFFVENGWLATVSHEDSGAIQFPLFGLDSTHPLLKDTNEVDATTDRITSLARIFDMTPDSFIRSDSFRSAVSVTSADMTQLTLDMFGFTTQRNGASRRTTRTLYTMGPTCISEMRDFLLTRFSDTISDCRLCRTLASFRTTRCVSCNAIFHNMCLENLARVRTAGEVIDNTITATEGDNISSENRSTAAAVDDNSAQDSPVKAESKGEGRSRTAHGVVSEWSLLSRGPFTREALDMLAETFSSMQCPGCQARSTGDNHWFDIVARKSRALDT